MVENDRDSDWKPTNAREYFDGVTATNFEGTRRHLEDLEKVWGDLTVSSRTVFQSIFSKDFIVEPIPGGDKDKNLLSTSGHADSRDALRKWWESESSLLLTTNPRFCHQEDLLKDEEAVKGFIGIFVQMGRLSLIKQEVVWSIAGNCFSHQADKYFK